jgi:phosphatidylglycerophosphate synthase
MITLLGFLTIVLNVATLFYYTSDLTECPHWVYYSFSLGLFLYQSLDAIDGKQARRTGTSGPLGELFDHGKEEI